MKDESDSDDEIDKQFDNYLKNSSINAAIGTHNNSNHFHTEHKFEDFNLSE